MQPAPLDISLYRGDDFGLMLRVYSGSFNATLGQYVKGPALDLTSWSGEAQIRVNEDTTSVLATFDVEVLNQSTNRGGIYVSMSSEVTAALAAAGVWDLQLTDSTDPLHPLVYTYLKGKVTVTKDVTRVGT